MAHQLVEVRVLWGIFNTEEAVLLKVADEIVVHFAPQAYSEFKVPVITMSHRNVRTSAYSSRGSLLPNLRDTDGVHRPPQKRWGRCTPSMFLELTKNQVDESS